MTHPDVTRFFMTIEEACELVIQAGAIGRDGEVLVLDMGEPVRILDVAERLIAQSGTDIEIVFTGLRPGEKPFHEELLATEEVATRRKHELISHVRVSGLGVADLEPLVLTAEPSDLRRKLQDLCLKDGSGGQAVRGVTPVPR